MTSLAELGFIVVMVDGMGTSFRSRAFENVCYKNLKDAGLPDHIAWIKAAARKYPYMDVDRVGIYGCSAGGQESTNAVLLYPDFYKAAYSACGCHDNRMDKIWWNELWLGYPVESKDNVGWYHKTDFEITATIGGEDFHYEGRFDIGDGEGDLISHIKNFFTNTLCHRIARLFLNGRNRARITTVKK